MTADSSNVSADEIKGKVTTDPAEIARWIGEGQEDERVSVIFGTYQSGHRIAEALRTSETTTEVLICDEAHRTAGLAPDEEVHRGPDKGLHAVPRQ